MSLSSSVVSLSESTPLSMSSSISFEPSSVTAESNQSKHTPPPHHQVALGTHDSYMMKKNWTQIPFTNVETYFRHIISVEKDNYCLLSYKVLTSNCSKKINK